MIKIYGLFFLLFFCLSFNLFAQKSLKDFICGQHKMNIRDGLEKKEFEGWFCYNSEERTIYSTSACKEKKCQADDEGPFEISWSKLKGPFGTPGFKACTILQGTPHLIDFLDKKERLITSSRCLFKDGSYIDTGRLLSRVKIIED